MLAYDQGIHAGVPLHYQNATQLLLDCLLTLPPATVFGQMERDMQTHPVSRYGCP